MKATTIKPIIQKDNEPVWATGPESDPIFLAGTDVEDPGYPLDESDILENDPAEQYGEILKWDPMAGYVAA